MTATINNPPHRWSQLVTLLDEVDDAASNIIWLLDERAEPLALDSLLRQSGHHFQRQPFPRWVVWRRAKTQLIYFNNSTELTVADLPLPTQAIWLRAPQFRLTYFWDILQRRLLNRPVAAATTHWQRLQQAVAVAYKPDFAEINLRLALAALANAQNRVAQEYAEKVIASNDNPLQQLTTLSIQAPLNLLNGDLAMAREQWRGLLTQSDMPDHWQAGAAAGLGWIHIKQEEFGQAQTDWQLAAHLAPEWAQPYLEIAKLSLRQGRPDNALTALRQASTRDPSSRTVQSSYGRLLHQLREYPDAVKALQQAVGQPAHPEEMARDYLILGRSQVALGQISGALVSLSQAAAFQPGSSAPHNALGNVLAQNGDYAGAIAHYERAILCGDLSLGNLAKIHNGLANACYQVGQHEAAIRNYEQAIALDYRYARAYNGLGMVLRATGRFDEATEAFYKATQLDNGYAAPYYGLGTIYSVTNQLDEAVRAYKASIAREPSSAMPHCSLAAIYQRQGRQDEATAQLVEAEQLIDREKAYNLACFAAIKGEAEVALEWLTQAIEETPGIVSWIKQDPDFANLRNFPQFQQLITAK